MRLKSVSKKQLSKVSGDLGFEAAPGQRDTVRAIIKVNRPGYVPEGIKVRSKIDDEMFTAEFGAFLLETLEDDDGVMSVAVSKRLRMID